MFEYIAKRPMLFSGILSVACASATFYLQSLFITVCVFVLSALFLMMIFKAKPQLIIATVMSVFVLFSCIMVCGDIRRAETTDTVNARCTLCVCDITYESVEFCTAEVEVINGRLNKGTKLAVTYNGTQLYAGQNIEADVTVKAVEGEYKNYYYSKEIYLKGKISDITFIPEKDDIVLKTVHKVRSYIKQTLFSKMDFSQAATLCAIIFGDNSYFTDEFYANVKGAGVSHVMVVSGMHLSIIILLFTGIAEKIFYSPYVKAVMILLVSLILTALCGFTMSMLRAGFTYVLIAISLIIGKQYNPENVLGAAVTFILISCPNAILSGAFQLSVASTFGILAVAVPVSDYIREKGLIKKLWLSEIVNSVIVTLSALVLTLPIIIRLFGYISNVALITNLLISYAVTLVLSLSIIALVLNLIFPSLADGIFILCDLITNYINTVINIFGSQRFSVTRLPEYFWIIAVLLIIGVFYVLLACKKQRYMLKLKEIDEKIIKESGNGTKWRQFLKRL